MSLTKAMLQAKVRDLEARLREAERKAANADASHDVAVNRGLALASMASELKACGAVITQSELEGSGTTVAEFKKFGLLEAVGLLRMAAGLPLVHAPEMTMPELAKKALSRVRGSEPTAESAAEKGPSVDEALKMLKDLTGGGDAVREDVERFKIDLDEAYVTIGVLAQMVGSRQRERIRRTARENAQKRVTHVWSLAWPVDEQGRDAFKGGPPPQVQKA